MSTSVAKWTFLSLCFKRNFLFALDFIQIPCWDCLELLPCFVHGSFCIRNFRRLWHRMKLVNQIVLSQSKQLLCLQCGLCEFGIVQIPLVALWIHRIPLYNHTLFWIIFHCQFSAWHSLSRCLFLLHTAWREPQVFPIFSSFFLRISAHCLSSGLSSFGFSFAHSCLSRF